MGIDMNTGKGHKPAPRMAATILAAGLGRRLGHQAKAALQIGDTSLLERLVGALRGAGIAHIQVVLGPYADTLLPLARRCGAAPLLHGRTHTSLVESQRLALQAHVDHLPGHDLMLLVADLPWLTTGHVAPLMLAWQARPEGVQAQVPMVDGVRGHPLILSAEAAAGIAALPAELGVRDWLSAHPDKVRPLPMADAAYVTDLDTPADLAAFRAAFQPE